MNELEIRVKAALIRGEMPEQILNRLRSEGIHKAEIERILNENPDLILSMVENQQRKMKLRGFGAALCAFFLIVSLYYVCVYGVFSKVFWALTIYGLVVAVTGDLAGGAGCLQRRD